MCSPRNFHNGSACSYSVLGKFVEHFLFRYVVAFVTACRRRGNSIHACRISTLADTGFTSEFFRFYSFEYRIRDPFTVAFTKGQMRNGAFIRADGLTRSINLKTRVEMVRSSREYGHGTRVHERNYTAHLLSHRYCLESTRHHTLVAITAWRPYGIKQI